MSSPKRSPKQDGSSWHVGEPWAILRRIEDGNRSCDHLMTMIQERADVESGYAQSLRQWASKWEDSLTQGSEYGSVLAAWRAVLQEASAVAKIHEDCRVRLMGEEGPYYNAYKWTDEHYHRTGTEGALQETAEARDDFESAQKGFSKLLSRVHRAKKAYHDASVQAYRARRHADAQTATPDVSAGECWKLRQRADALALERERLKQAYLRRVLECNVNGRDRYAKKMTSLLERCQAFERRRLEHVQSQLQLFVRNLNTHSGTGMSQTYRGILNQLCKAAPALDVEEWARHYGAAIQPNWPKFEDMDPRKAAMSTGSQSGEMTDDWMDDFTTDDFDSEQDSDPRHTQQRLPGRPEHAHQGLARPYRTHQHEAPPYQAADNVDTRRHARGWSGNQQDHQQRPLASHDYAQNEDMSERWLEERLGGRGGRRGHHHRARHHHHHDDHRDVGRGHGYATHHHDDATHKRTPWNEHGQSYELRGRLYEGQRSQDHHSRDTVWHRRKERSQHANEHDRSKGHQSRHDHGPPGSVYDTLATSHSDVSLLHGNRPSSTALESPDVGHDYYGDDGFHGKGQSDESSAEHPTGTSLEETRVREQADMTHQSVTQVTAHAHGSQTQPSNQNTTRAWASPSDAPANARLRPDHSEERGAAAEIAEGQGQPQTYIERRGGAGSDAERREAARRAMRPDDGERLVRALYDFKPATRDEMALVQNEYLVQIGNHLSNGWAYGRKGGTKGHFPASYVQ